MNKVTRLDALTRSAVTAAVRSALEEALETTSEVWLTAEKLESHFGAISRAWLHRYGHLLPRTRIVTTDSEGRQHRSQWMYPRNKIQRMIQQGTIVHLGSSTEAQTQMKS